MSTTEEQLTTRIVLRAVLPLIKVMVEDNPKTSRLFTGVNGVIQFTADDPEGPVGAHIRFTDGQFELVQGLAEKPEVLFSFPSLAKLNDMFRGKPVVPRIGPLLLSGLRRPGLLMKSFHLLLGLKLLMPDAKVTSPEAARMKVKMTLYMVSTALSQLNKSGDPEMTKWTGKQPERIYQWSVDGTDIACYLRVKAGQSMAGRGMYTRRKPFVHMRFASVDAALPILGNQIDLVVAMTKGMVVNDGSPEYGSKIGDFMMRVGNLLL